MLFDSFAKANNFDPLVADNWHKTKSQSFKAFKVLKNKTWNEENIEKKQKETI